MKRCITELIDVTTLIVIIIVCMFVNMVHATDSKINNVSIQNEEENNELLESHINKHYKVELNNVYSEEVSYEEVKRVVEEKQRIQELERQKEIERTTVYALYKVSSRSSFENVDLKCFTTVNTDEMNKLIEYWVRGRNSELTGCGQAFIDASKATGYDPIFLLSLLGCEAGWTVSDLHSSKNNPYSINMTDSNPSGGYKLGDSFSEGIIEGAKWIHKNYYVKYEQTTLYKMNNKKYHSYCSSKSWSQDISNTMKKSYYYLDMIKK